ncbi:MAG: mandelate racemase/muconate lactonizing enzyme family protein [Rhizobiales bacterium]|nr:mandelate racemase/muconate lactonizing enzyme family protein [Hyphomicrobiales bacterium]
MNIERIECVPLKMPLPRTFRGSSYFMTHRCTIVTRVYTSEGIVGEIYNGDEFETQGEVVKIILEEIQPLLLGRDAFNIEGCWQAMLKLSFNILRDRKLAMCAIACVDSALWDAVGKALDVPLYKLWGGYRDRLPSICIAGYYEEGKTLADFGREMESIRAAGHAGCKFKVGGRTPKEDAERVRTGRNIRWFEEPVRWYNDRLDMAAARAQTRIPICAGQSEISKTGCRDLMMAGAIDVCNFDASWGGGPTEWRRVASIAAAFTVEMAHHEEPQIATHLLASIPHGTYLETFHPDRDPLFPRIVANRSPFKDGWYQLPEGPGFGVELDRAAIERYKV